jgi:Ca2+-binding EF-hand superfamily protein
LNPTLENHLIVFNMAAESSSVGGVQLTAEEEMEFREIFNLVDRDGGGSISKEELGQLMETLGIHASPVCSPPS